MRIASDGGSGTIEETDSGGNDIQSTYGPPPPPPQDGFEDDFGGEYQDGFDTPVNSYGPAFQPEPAPRPPAPQYSKEQADRDAQALYEATEGGVTGWGTDEDAIWQTLEGKSAKEIAVIKQSYRDHYGKDLDQVLSEETGGDDRAHVDALLGGKENQAATDAVQIQSEMDGVFGDEDQVLQTLEKASPGERQAIAASYASRNDAPAGLEPERFLLAQIQDDSNFSPAEKQRAKDLLAASTATSPVEAQRLEADAAALRIEEAVDGMGTDEETVREMLGGRSKGEIDDLGRAYRERYGVDLRDRLIEESDGAEQDEILALYDRGRGDAGGAAARDAARVEQAVDGLGTNEGAIRDVFTGKDAQQIEELATSYERQYGQSLRGRVLEETEGAEQDELLSLLDHGQDGGGEVGRERDAARLKQALDGAGTDEASVRQILQGKSKDEIDALARAYQERYGEDLRARLDDELGGREQVELLDQTFDLGRIDPEDPGAGAERLRRLRERQETEQSFGSSLTGGVQDLIKGESDEGRLDRNVERAEQAAAGGDQARAGQLLGYAEGDLDSLQKAKDSAADAAATGAAVVASTGVVVLTAGTATPLVVAAGAALAGGAASAGTYAAMQGDAADPVDIAQQGAIGAATGATAGVGLSAAAGRTALAAGAEGAAAGLAREGAVVAGEQVAAGGVRRAIIDGAVQGAKAGAAGGAADGAIRSATERETWEDGLGDGLLRVGERAAVGAAAGAVLGGATGAAMGAGAEALAAREARQFAETVQGRIDLEPGKFRLDYSPSEVRGIAARGKELDLDEQAIEDLIFIGSRNEKRISAGELIQQMENYATEIQPRGYPYRFESREHFAEFEADVREGLGKAGIATDDVRVQGSALRKPNAGDVDIAVMVDDATFDEMLVKAFSPPNSAPIRTRANGEAIDLTKLSRDELDELVAAIKAEELKPAKERTFNARAQTFAHAFEVRKMREQETGAAALEGALRAKYGKVDISVMSRGGGFDMEPYLPVE